MSKEAIEKLNQSLDEAEIGLSTILYRKAGDRDAHAARIEAMASTWAVTPPEGGWPFSMRPLDSTPSTRKP